MKVIIGCLLLFCIVATAQLLPQWTAYFPLTETAACSNEGATNDFDTLSLATDSKGRVWQYSGRSNNCKAPFVFSLRYFDRDSRKWTVAWKKGDSYGPVEPRGDNLMWIDKDDNIYILGGQDESYTVLNDFWHYDPVLNSWTNLTVNNGQIDASVRGTPTPTAYPGPRRGSAYWYTPDDNCLWVFGGFSPDNTEDGGPGFADLWRYSIDDGQWTFMAGHASQIADIITAEDPWDVTPSQRWGVNSAVDGDNNLWLYGGEMMNDLWMFNRTSGWKHLKGTTNTTDRYYTPYCADSTLNAPIGQFSPEVQPQCAAYSSMTYIGNNTLALWTSYTKEDDATRLWLYYIPTNEWMLARSFSYDPAVGGLYKPDDASNPGRTYYTRVFTSGALWSIADAHQSVFVMDFDYCNNYTNPCSVNATCSMTSVFDAPTCTCKEGYEGDGITCTEIVPAPIAAPVLPPVASTTPVTTPVKAPSAKTSLGTSVALSSAIALAGVAWVLF